MEQHNQHHPADHSKKHAAHSMPKGKHEHHEEHSGHGAHDHSAMIADFLTRFWVSLVLTVPVVAISPMFQMAVGYQFDFPGRDWVSVSLGTIIFFYGGWPFLKGLWAELKDKNPGMMTLIGVAISVAYFYSVIVVFGLVEGMDFFWELATLIRQ